MFQKTERTEELESYLRQQLKDNLPLYADGQRVAVHEEDEKIFIQYKSSKKIFATGFDVQIEGATGYILTFNISEEHKRQKNGTKMYNIIKELCKRHGCRRIEVTASGDGVDFWPAMGLKPNGEFTLEEMLV